MGISKKVKALLGLSGKKQADLMDVLGVSSPQSLTNKFTNERWSGDDLAKVAQFCGCQLAFITADGQKIIIEDGRTEKAPDA